MFTKLRSLVGCRSGNNRALLRGLLYFLFLVEGSTEIENSDDEDDQQRQRDGEFENGRTFGLEQKTLGNPALVPGTSHD